MLIIIILSLCTGSAVSSGLFGLTRPGDQVSLDTTQLQTPHDDILMDYITNENISVTDGIVNLDGHTLCFTVTTAVRDAVSSIVPIQPVCGECGNHHHAPVHSWMLHFVTCHLHAGLTGNEMRFLLAAAVLVIVYSIARLLLEVGQFIQELHLYFLEVTAWIEVTLFICAIIFASAVGRECLCPTEWQWQIGVVAVFLVWAYLILYMRRLRILGKTPYYTIYRIVCCKVYI